MALIMGQRSVPGTAPVFLAQVPPGPGQLIVSAAGSSSVLIGQGTVLTAGNGFPVPSGGLSVQLFPGGGATQLYAITTSGTVGVGFIISTSYGLAQPGQQ